MEDISPSEGAWAKRSFSAHVFVYDIYSVYHFYQKINKYIEKIVCILFYRFMFFIFNIINKSTYFSIRNRCAFSLVNQMFKFGNVI